MQKHIVIFLCGFISGFTLLISGNTLNFWLSSESIDIRLIGIFSIISLPYAINFIWAPLLDSIKVPFLFKTFGQRMAWVYLLQLLLAISVYTLSLRSPHDGLIGLSICAIFVSLFSSTQDTALGALRTEIIEPAQQGVVAGVYIVGYRVGMLLASSGAIFCSDYLSWQSIYQIFAFIILSFPLILTIALSNLQLQKIPNTQLTRGNFVIKILQSLGSTKFIILLLLFLVLYRLPDNFINVMINPFLIHTGFDAAEIATVGKFLGIMAAILGGLIASRIMNKLTIADSLLYFGIAHAIAHSMFIAQDIAGHNLPLLFFVMGFESITGGMAMAAYIAYITSLCSGKYRATQYAILSSMMGLSRAILPGISGFIVSECGWQIFYLFTSIATIPALILLWYLRLKSQSSIT